MVPTQLENRLTFGSDVIFDGLSPAVTTSADIAEVGAFLVVQTEKSNSRHIVDLGRLPEILRFTASHRYEPYWMKPMAGTKVSAVPPETQFLLGQLNSGKYLLLVPLFGDLFRYSLRGRADHHLDLMGETGDSFTPGHGGLALFVAVGEDPFELSRHAAMAVTARLSRGKLRRDKRTPDFIDRFGWCTWDAFYTEVSAEKLRLGLESFRAGGVSPKFVILDDGWQSVVTRDTGEARLTDFAANEKFPGGLLPSVRMAKEQFAVEYFLVWHAMQGYWGGVDELKMPDFAVVNQTRQFGEGILQHEPTFNQTWWGNVVGLVPPEHIGRFFEAYHQSLSEQGVDGIKVDSQAVLEGVATGLGGRVKVTMAYRAGLERSAEKYFNGRLINCMSNAQETWYGSETSTLLRSSIDFFPHNPASHGAHLYTNAMMGVWFGEFMLPDWDMFHTAHQYGAFHAAARAISGGPVYCSDKPEGHDFALLSKLVCSDGTVLRSDEPGRLTRDCLLRDPTQEDVLLKIWNRSGSFGVVGVFFAQAAKTQSQSFSAVVRARDVEGLRGENYACWSHCEGRLRVVSRDEAVSVTLRESEFELFTYAPVVGGFAAIGLADKFNSGSSIANYSQPNAGNCTIELRDGGRFIAFSVIAPRSVSVAGVPQEVAYNEATGLLEVRLLAKGAQRLVLEF